MLADIWRRFRAQPMAMAGLLMLALMVLLSLAAPALVPRNPGDLLGFNPADANHPPTLSWTYLLGTDSRGRSVLALLLWGGRASLAVGLGAAILAAIVGMACGVLAARPGVPGLVIGALIDLCQAAPPLLVVLLLTARLGGTPPLLLMAAFAASGWPVPARLTRAAVAATLQMPFVEAARASGVGNARLLARYLLPEALAALAAWTASAAASYLALSAGLDFLGLGLPSGSISWGAALAGAQDALAIGNWWWLAGGGLALALTTLALGAVAQGVARAVDPLAVITTRHPLLRVEDTADAATPNLAFRQTPSATRTEGDGIATVSSPPWRRRGGATPEDEWAHRAPPSSSGATPSSGGLPPYAAICPRWANHRIRIFLTLLTSQCQAVFHTMRRFRRVLRVMLPLVLLLLALGAGLRAQARRPSESGPSAALLAARARSYPLRRDRAASYIATVTYAATESVLGGRRIPWAAWGTCLPELGHGRCAQASVALWFSGGRERALSEGSVFICAPRRTWGYNPMAGLATTMADGCGPLGPVMSGLGATAGVIAALLPRIGGDARVIGQDAIAGQRCILLALDAHGRACIDTATGLALRIERLDRTNQPAAEARVTAISYGLDLAPELFANPIPGGRGPLIDGLSQPLLNLLAADDLALFTTLSPTTIPAGLVARTPTFDSYYDDQQGYALEQRVRQVYQDSRGSTALTLIETLPGSGWDATPPRRQARALERGGLQLLIWQGGHGQPALVRFESIGTAVLLSSRVYSPATLIAVALGMG